MAMAYGRRPARASSTARGRERLPIGDDGFSRAAAVSVSWTDRAHRGCRSARSCRHAVSATPGASAKTLNMTTDEGILTRAPPAAWRTRPVRGTEVWELGDGALSRHFSCVPDHLHRAYARPGDAWGRTCSRSKGHAPAEFARHSTYLLDSEKCRFSREGRRARSILSRSCFEVGYTGSMLVSRSRLLRASPPAVVLLIDARRARHGELFRSR